MHTDTLRKVKLFLRINHNKLDEDIMGDIDSCLADLKLCGVIAPDPTDPLIFNALKLYCRSLYIDDPAKAQEYLKRYEALKSCLMVAEGYGWKDGEADE